MAYNLLKDFTGEEDKTDSDHVSTSPYWVLYFIGVPTPLSFSRENGFSSIKKTASGGHRSRMVVINDCVSLQINNSKTNHTKSLQAMLKQGRLNYLGNIYAGDWVMAWIVNDKTSLNVLLDKIKKEEPYNKWESGLKFVGRVESIRKNISISPDGNLDSNYSLTAFAFKELDSEIFYDVNLAEKLLNQPGYSWLAKISLDIKNLFEIDQNNKKATPNNGHKIIGSLISAFMGKGAGNLLNPTDEAVLSGARGGGIGVGEQRPYAYIVPTAVGKMLNRKGDVGAGRSEEILGYTDILQLHTGVQIYEKLESRDFHYFLPKIEKEDGFIKFSGQPNLGSFAPVFPSFVNRPLWSILQQFSNPLINELYTCMRVDKEGNIIPQVIFRQIPFTTPTFAKINNNRPPNVANQKVENNIKIFELEQELNSPKVFDDVGQFDLKGQELQNEIATRRNIAGPSLDTTVGQVPVTPFHSLPRWVLPSVLIKNMSLGRSDATHVNLVHVYGQDQWLKVPINIPTQLAQNPPIVDNLDIQRSGVRAFMATIPSDQIDQVGKAPTTWMQLVADQLMASHLTLNGAINCLGIHMPICEGDNIETGGMLFHIESVVHTCSISDQGVKSFTTSLTVTNGMALNTEGTDYDTSNTFYLGISEKNSVGHDAGLTIDSEIDDGFLSGEGGETILPESSSTGRSNNTGGRGPAIEP